MTSLSDHDEQIKPVQQGATKVAPLRVLLIDDDPERANIVEVGLSENAVVHIVSHLSLIHI